MTANNNQDGIRVRFARRRDLGLLWGRTLPQLLCFLAALAVVVTAFRIGTVAAFWVLLPLAAAVAGLGFARLHGRALVDALPAALADALLAWAGQAEYRGGPYRRRAGDTVASPRTQPRLPGPLSKLEIHGYQISSTDDDGGELGLVVDRADGTVVAALQVTGRNLLFEDPRQADAHAAGFGRLLDGLARAQSPIVAIQSLSRIRPDVTDDAWRELSVRGRYGHRFAQTVNEQLLAGLHGQSLVHESYLAVRIAPHRARHLVRQFGGGDHGAAALAYQTLARIGVDLAAAGIDVIGWVSKRGLAALIRSALDPAADPMIARRGGGLADEPGGDPGLPSGVSPVAAEPMLIRRARSYVAHADCFSRTWWIEELPHAADGVPVGFLAPLVLSLPCRHTLSLTLQPVDARRAQRVIDLQTSTTDAQQEMARKVRRRRRRADDREVADIHQREADLVEGFASYRLAVILTVTAGSLEELELVSAQAESAISACSMEGQVWSVETDQAYFMAALPLARGLR